MASILSREKNDKFTCEKFTARKRVGEMQEICQCILRDNLHFWIQAWGVIWVTYSEKRGTVVTLQKSQNC